MDIEANQVWTVCDEHAENCVEVNPGPDGQRWLTRKTCTDALMEALLKAYEGEYDPWVVQCHYFDRRPDGSVDMDAVSVDEKYIGSDAYVISEDEKLIGFRVPLNNPHGRVFWIADFDEGGKYFLEGDYTDELILYETNETRVYGFLTHSRW